MKKHLPLLSLILLLTLPPLVGGWIAGEPLAHYFHFPTTGEALIDAPFSPALFWTLAGIITAIIAFVTFMALARPAESRAPEPERHPFPRWGWAALAVIAGAWWLSWTEIAILEPLRRLTFIPLWLGYIALVNALALKRTGHCLMLDRPLYFAALFPASALLWWYFEFLNRFTGSWYYSGIEPFGPASYHLLASLAFTTVLPALLSTRQLLATHPRLVAHLNRGRPIPAPPGEVTVALLLIFGLASLIGLASWPRWLYPTVWLAPLALLTAWQLLLGRQTIFSAIRNGDWSRVVLAALAGLVCGLFWELWNSGALVQWHYNLPAVDRYRLFEMPLLGWAGYLPFGLLCVAAADLLATPWRNNPVQPAKPKPFPVKIVIDA